MYPTLMVQAVGTGNPKLVDLEWTHTELFEPLEFQLVAEGQRVLPDKVVRGTLHDYDECDPQWKCPEEPEGGLQEEKAESKRARGESLNLDSKDFRTERVERLDLEFRAQVATALSIFNGLMPSTVNINRLAIRVKPRSTDGWNYMAASSGMSKRTCMGGNADFNEI